MIYLNSKEIAPNINGGLLSRVMFGGGQIWPKVSTEIPIADTKAGDVLLWDKVNQRKLFAASDKLNNYPADSYMPIGVVVIPASHNVYGDGSCGVMSLKEMGNSAPDEGGTSYGNIYWGQYGADLDLPNLNEVVTGNTIDGSGNGRSTTSHLPSDRFESTGTQCLHDLDAYYYEVLESSPSPYLTDGSRNSGYYQTSLPSSSNNALSDFDGIGNSKILWDAATSQGDWKTASIVINNLLPGYSPAACLCWRYHTEGTNQGDWYLPACGELGYIMPPFNRINTAITNIIQAYGSSAGVTLNDHFRYWSSSEFDGNGARCVDTGSGLLDDYQKNIGNSVRSFLRVYPFDSIEGFDPDEATNGVYIYANNSKLYKPSSWYTALNGSALGVAVVTDNCRFAISKELQMSNDIQWSSDLYGTDIDGILTATSQDTAITDYAGQNNTKLVISTAPNENSSNNAAYYCYVQTLNGKRGYLPAAGELAAMYNNKNDIDEALVLIGSKSISDRVDEFSSNLPFFWSSTECDSISAWRFSWENSTLRFSSFLKNTSASNRFAFPLFPLPSNAASTENVIYINQLEPDPSKMVTGDVQGDVIKWIRDNSHRYIAQSFDETNGVTLRQLDDNDSTKFADGTDASKALMSPYIDVFMKMPDFWYYGTEGDNVEIHFTNIDPQDEDTWVHWDGNTLIGAYEGYLFGEPLRSVSGVQSSGNFTQAEAMQWARNKGTGYQIVDWQMHCVMGILFYAWYGNTNSQAICGSGTNAYDKVSGQTNSLGMTDTDSANGNTMSINFWGLENWWGNKYEWMEGLSSTSENQVQVSVPGSSETRELSWPYDGSWGKKLKFGKYCDLNKIVSDDASDSTYYCDYNYGPSGSDRVSVRSGSDSASGGGISCAYINDVSSYSNSNLGARLCYRGKVSISD